MTATLTFAPSIDALSAHRLVVIGRKERLLHDDVQAALPADLGRETWERMVKGIDPGDQGRSASTYTPSGKVMVGVLPEHCSRHNTPTRATAIPRLAKAAAANKDCAVLLVLDHADHALAHAMGLARALPTYSAASTQRAHEVTAVVLAPEGPIADVARLQAAADGVRYAAHLVDMPPNELHTTALVQEARELATAHPGVELTLIEGQDLDDAGLGGLWGVGRASDHPPALVVLDWAPSGATGNEAWVGKGIVYDTGGLSIKGKTGMVGMKTDMGGAAAVLAAFKAAIAMGVQRNITAVLCVAENSVGPSSTRPDDVLRMYSGRSVEVNNTDAEGRLVLADGVAWAAKHRTPGRIIDMATLTGAQMVATGQLHAALYCNDEDLEAQAVSSGKYTGELVHPLPFAPEFYRKEFTSTVADMRNSVKDRANAQASCAGQFIYNHLHDYTGPWLHVDIAGPSTSSGRGTGFGVGLLLALAGVE